MGTALTPWLLAAALLALGGVDPVAAATGEAIAFESGDRLLHGLLYKPAGPGPFPVVLYNHGSAPGLLSNQAFEAIAPVFTTRGWIFLAPYRRGQGLSSDAGPYIRDQIQTALAQGGPALGTQTMIRLLSTEQLQDQMAALTWVRRQPFVQPERVAAMGNSFGGIETVLGAEHAEYCAAVDAAGGSESWDQAPPLRAFMRDAVRHAKTPILFIQSRGDFTIEPSRTLYAAMKARHEPAAIRLYPAYGDSPEDAHSFVYRDPSIWTRDVMQFLREHCSQSSPPR